MTWIGIILWRGSALSHPKTVPHFTFPFFARWWRYKMERLARGIETFSTHDCTRALFADKTPVCHSRNSFSQFPVFSMRVTAFACCFAAFTFLHDIAPRNCAFVNADFRCWFFRAASLMRWCAIMPILSTSKNQFFVLAWQLRLPLCLNCCVVFMLTSCLVLPVYGTRRVLSTCENPVKTTSGSFHKHSSVKQKNVAVQWNVARKKRQWWCQSQRILLGKIVAQNVAPHKVHPFIILT